MQVQSLGEEDPLEESMPTHSRILAWRILWTEEPGRLQSMWSQRVRRECSDLAYIHTCPERTDHKKMFSFISVQFVLLNNKGSWDSNLLPQVPTCDWSVREGLLLLTWRPWGERNRESRALRRRMGWRASGEHFPQRHSGWLWGRCCPLTMRCLGGPETHPRSIFPPLSRTPPSAGPTEVVHLMVYQLHIHPKRRHLTVGVPHSTGTRGSLGVRAAGLRWEGRSWAPCRFLHLQWGRLGDTHEQVYFFRGSGKCPRESYDVNKPRRIF